MAALTTTDLVAAVATVRALSVAVDTAPSGADMQQARLQLNGALDGFSKSLQTTPVSVTVLDDTLAALTLPQDTLVGVVLLHIKTLTTGAADQQLFAQQARELIFNGARDALQSRAEAFKTICRSFVSVCINTGIVAAAIAPLQYAVQTLALSPAHLTPLHADFVKVCLLSRNYKAALPVLQEDIFEVDPAASSLEPRDALTYFYYAGMVWTGLKQFDRAHDCFLMAITMPAQALSAIVVEAYKKIMLISLLQTGQAVTLPKYTSDVVSRHLPGLTTPYGELAKVFATRMQDEADKVVTKYQADFERDHNLGLVRQVLGSLKRRNIQRLTNTFVTLSLADIAKAANLLGSDEAERVLLRMVADGEILASIDQCTGMVSFSGEDESQATVRLLDHHIHQTIESNGRMVQADRRVALSDEYHKRTQLQERAGLSDFDDLDLRGPAERITGGMRLQ